MERRGKRALGGCNRSAADSPTRDRQFRVSGSADSSNERPLPLAPELEVRTNGKKAGRSRPKETAEKDGGANRRHNAPASRTRCPPRPASR